MIGPVDKNKKLNKKQWESRLASEEAILTLGHDWNRIIRIAASVIGAVVFLSWIFWDRILEIWGSVIPQSVQEDGLSFPWAVFFVLGFFKPEIKVVFTPAGIFIYERSLLRPLGRHEIIEYGVGARLKLIRRSELGRFGKVRKAELEYRERFFRLAPEKSLTEEDSKLIIERLNKLMSVYLRSE